jgi:F0F1-type ATP synthase assembly protein I
VRQRRRALPDAPEPLTVKFNARTIATTDDAFARALDFALVTLVFVGLGALVDWLLGTMPVFMIVFVIVGLCGQFARLWYSYDAAMREHETARTDARASSVGAQRAVDATSDPGASEVGV